MVNTTAEPWYQYFHEDGTTQSGVLLAVFGLRALWATLGLLFNLAIVHATWTSKSLHGVCNILIALESFFGIFLDSSFYISFAIFLGGIKFVPYQNCFPIILPEATCGNCAQMTMVLIGADRLLSVLFPIWYKTRRRRHCLAVDGTIIIAYAVYSIIIFYMDFLQSDQNVLLSCSSHELGRSAQLGPLMNVSGMVLSGTLMTCYTLVWVITFVLYPKYVNEKNKRLIKSLTYIIGMNLVGVFVKTTMNFMFNTYWKGADAFVKNPYAIGMSFMTIAVYSSNAPVLYLVSKEYRTRIQHLWWLRPILKKEPSSSADVHHSKSQPPPLMVPKGGNISDTNLQRNQQPLFTRTAIAQINFDA